MDWHETVFELIDMRSFSNLWFWIALAVLWSTASHWVLGVPYDMVTRARRHGGQANVDLEDMVRVNINRLLYIDQLAGLWLLSGVCFVLSVLVILGFFYRVEFAQAVFLLSFPMTIVGALNLMQARKIKDNDLTGELLWKSLSRHRTWIQGIGMVSIFVTSIWGMYQNLSIGALGG
ncbi:MAG: component of SufBCD complex [Paracoccaceae bacterium]